MIDFTLRQLEYFVAVLDHGSLTEAAKRSNISQPAASMAVAQLEKSLGVDLLIRTRSKRLVPTGAGNELAARARRILADAAEVPAALSQGMDEMKGSVRVGCMTAISPRLIPALIEWFAEKWPDVLIDFVEGPAERLQTAVAEGALDLAFIYSLQAIQGVELQHIADARAHIMIATDHPLAAQNSLRFADLEDEDAVLLDVPPSAEKVLAMFHTAGVEPRVRWKSVVAQTIRGLVSSGRAYSVTNVWPGVRTSYADSNITLVPIADKIPLNRLVAAVAPDIRQPRRVLEVLTAAREIASSEAHLPRPIPHTR
ncbi:LysR substrate-binding domain-containing protein [Arthrobacter sp. ISL-30]|uniref:LysR family transcriptional regulator n=1 Tax=Arthrobacter sp. ISL-30 TaxID=2819109 RepID=UPI001BE80B29|nr:LysR substrate-binding domain-containing protein [Arthrobacter sp. ISL-30]MBT2513273.1 LysR family transcriptional regulator [Arthrobacter sp. ISL-30]